VGKLETKIKSKVLEEFQEANKTISNPELQKWLKGGGKVMGYFCSYGPEEIITAAGVVPIRVRATGSQSTELADAYLSSINCSFCRHAFNAGLSGDYDFLEGAIWLNNCDHVRRIYDNWRRKIKTPLAHQMSLPKMSGPDQVEWYRQEMEIFKATLEKHLGVTITEDKLREAIKLHNETRQLLRALYELRKADNPPISGSDALSIVVASTCMPRTIFNEKMKQLLGDLKAAEGIKGYRARIMLIGSILDDPEYIKVIEGIGGLVVTDSLCFGTRICWADVDEKSSDPLTALAKFYIQEKPACPRAFDRQEDRAKFVQSLAKDFKVDGIIGLRMVMCDLWAGELYMTDKDLKAIKMPYLQLDREYGVVGAGQLRTRVQAFIESMGK
jgi:bzd-type benzoyl-CoA reductase N subunit